MYLRESLKKFRKQPPPPVGKPDTTIADRIRIDLPPAWLLYIWLLVCLACVAQQPLRLGFYLDDWAVIADTIARTQSFSPALFRTILEIDPSRPGMALLRFLASSLLRGSPALWQFGLLLTNVLVVWFLAKLGQELVDPLRACPHPGLIGIAAVWLILPWNSACQFWPSLLVLDLLMAAFAWIAILTVRDLRSGCRWPVKSALLYLFICLCYEAFYFQFIPLLGLGLFLAISSRVSIRSLAHSAGCFTAMQIVAVVWYRISKVTGAQKPISDDWPGLLHHNLTVLIPAVRKTVPEVDPLVIVLVVVVGILAMSMWIRSRLEMGWAFVVLGFTCLFGTVLSIFAFTLGGRVVDPLGVEGRTYCLACFWFLVLAMMCGYYLPRKPLEQWSMMLTTMILGVLLGIAHVARLNDWAVAWSEQQQILRRAPLSGLRQTDVDATILYLNRLFNNGAPIFAATWDLRAAVRVTLGPSYARDYLPYSPWGGPMVWNGRQLTYTSANSIVDTHSLYIWDGQRGSIYRATTPIRINEDRSVVSIKTTTPVPPGGGL